MRLSRRDIHLIIPATGTTIFTVRIPQLIAEARTFRHPQTRINRCVGVHLDLDCDVLAIVGNRTTSGDLVGDGLAMVCFSGRVGEI